jgi:hypothetical protein
MDERELAIGNAASTRSPKATEDSAKIGERPNAQQFIHRILSLD